ncbi:MAG TPA: DUF5677 domain-containing protein [Nitrospira sp.]|nr:DUF5677 domain-containing protein [Nitrospira sp.]
MISELGFFSPEAIESQRQIRVAYREVFEVSEQLCELLLRLLRDAELDRISAKNMAMNALAAKSLELFQSSLILLERGCIPAAKVICRPLIETVYKLCAIQISTNAIDLYAQQARLTRLQKLKSVQKYKQKHKNASIAPGIEAEIQSLSTEKPKKTEPHQWASLAQMEDFHNLYYQGMSDDVHANIESLNHYFDEASTHLINFGPSDKDLALVATACQRTMVNAIEKYAQFLNVRVSEELSLLNPKIDALEDKP